MGLFNWFFDTKDEKKESILKNEKTTEAAEELKIDSPNGRQVKYLDIDDDQKNSFLSDLGKLNLLVDEANHIIDDFYPKLVIDSKTSLKFMEEPKTRTGKEPKCPYTLTFNAHDNPGAIYYFKDMTIAGARFTVWKRQQGITIDTGFKDGKMEVERITLNTLSEGYKKRIYTKHPASKKAPQKHFNKYVPNERDLAGQRDASQSFRKGIIQKYYSDYQYVPFISKDREINTPWVKQVTMFPDQSLVKKEMMIRFEDGFLPGHVYMLYWLDKYLYGYRRIPSYFEYKYGICFDKELNLLKKYGYVDDNGKPTDTGLEKVKEHYQIVENHNYR